MRHMQVALLASIGGAILATSAFAGHVNTGGDRPMIACPSVLTPPTTPPGTLGAPKKILYAPSEADDPAYRAAIAAINGDTVDYFDARAGTPDATLLNTYDCVHTWANFAYLDNVGFGNNLADFVDQGGRVVLGAFCTFTSGNFLSGRIMTTSASSTYCPVVSPTGSNHFSPSPYAGDGTTCIHTGVTAYDSFYRDVLVTQGTGIVDGHFTDGEIGHAYRPDFNVVYSNGSGCIQLGGTGDWARLVANACSTCGRLCAENAAWSNYGTGFPGTFGIPTFTSNTNPVLCQPVTLLLSNSLGSPTPGVIFLGFSAPAVGIPSAYGGLLWVNITSVLGPFTIPAGGASLTTRLPCDATLCGLDVFLQTWEADAGAAKLVSFTQGLELDLGS